MSNNVDVAFLIISLAPEPSHSTQTSLSGPPLCQLQEYPPILSAVGGTCCLTRHHPGASQTDRHPADSLSGVCGGAAPLPQTGHQRRHERPLAAADSGVRHRLTQVPALAGRGLSGAEDEEEAVRLGRRRCPGRSETGSALCCWDMLCYLWR